VTTLTTLTLSAAQPKVSVLPVLRPLAFAVARMGGFVTTLTAQAAVLLRRWLLLAAARERSACRRGGV
jgi:hypothetical protein